MQNTPTKNAPQIALSQSQKEAVFCQLQKLKNASATLALAGADARNNALCHIALLLESKKEDIKKANALDIENARKNGLSNALIERLILDDKQIESMRKSVLEIKSQSEVLGEVLDGSVRPSGIRICQIAVPLGVVAIFYESRPNVTIDAAALCIKSGNAALLKGGKEASYSNQILGQILQEALAKAGLSTECVFVLTPSAVENLTNNLANKNTAQNKKNNPKNNQKNITENTAQNLTNSKIIASKDCPKDFSQKYAQSLMQAVLIEIMQARDFVDLLIPRGGSGLIDFVLAHSKIPVIFHEAGICHAYIDKDLDSTGQKYALDICLNAKISRPSACNAIECVLIHAQIAPQILPNLVENLAKNGVENRICQKGLEILESCLDFCLDSCSGYLAKNLKVDFASKIKPASKADYGKEFGELIVAIKVVNSIDEALAHIAKYGSKHSEIIITQSLESSEIFCANVEASAVFVNASSRFNDGGEFGLGAEIGISTQKLHARGPMGARHLTTTKYIVQGNGSVRE